MITLTTNRKPVPLPPQLRERGYAEANRNQEISGDAARADAIAVIRKAETRIQGADAIKHIEFAEVYADTPLENLREIAALLEGKARERFGAEPNFFGGTGKTVEEDLDDLFERREAVKPLGLCPILNNRSRRRDRKTWWTIDDSGFLLTPRTVSERAKRTIAAIVRARRLNLWNPTARHQIRFAGTPTAEAKSRHRRKQRAALRSQSRLARVIAGNPVFRESVTLPERARLFVAYLLFSE
jgi:hypothetical protein